MSFSGTDWPLDIRKLWDVLSVTNIDAFNAVQVNCHMEDFDFYDLFVITLTYPMVILLVIVVMMWGYASADSNSDATYNLCWKLIILVSFVIYPSVSATVLQAWHCREIEGKGYLTADYRILCWDSTGYDANWLLHAQIAIGAFLIYPLGIPCLYYCVLKSNEDALYDESHPDFKAVSAKYGFLYETYEKGTWYWELVMLAEKLILTGLLIFIKPDSISQLASGFTISMFFFIAHVRCQAYINDKDDDLQFCAMLGITFTLFGGILLKTDTQNEGPYGSVVLTGLLLAMNTGVFAMLAAQVFFDCTDSTDTSLHRLQKKVVTKAISELFERKRPEIISAVHNIGLHNFQASEMETMISSLLVQIPDKVATLDEFDGVYEEVHVETAFTDPMTLVDSIIKLSRKFVTTPVTVDMCMAFAKATVDPLVEALKSSGCPATTTARVQALDAGVAKYCVDNGLRSFTTKWLALTEELQRKAEEVTLNAIKKAQFDSLFKSADQKLDRMTKIVYALDTSGDGTLQVSEIKELFSKLLGVPADQIADDQAEVMEFAGMKTDEMIETLMTKVDKDRVDTYYKAMFPEEYIPEEAALVAAEEASVLAGQVQGLNEDEKIDKLCIVFACQEVMEEEKVVVVEEGKLVEEEASPVLSDDAALPANNGNQVKASLRTRTRALQRLLSLSASAEVTEEMMMMTDEEIEEAADRAAAARQVMSTQEGEVEAKEEGVNAGEGQELEGTAAGTVTVTDL